MKYIIVGGVTGGAGTAARLRRLDENAEIIIFEKGAYISYSNCSIPYRLSDTVDQTAKLILNTPESFLGIYNIDVRVSSEIIAIDRKAKEVKVKDLKNNREYKETYDKKCRRCRKFLFLYQKRWSEKNLSNWRRLYRHRGCSKSSGGGIPGNCGGSNGSDS